MGYKVLNVAGLDVVFRNVPGSGITRVKIAGADRFGFDPESQSFVNFIDGHRVLVTPDLPAIQLRALIQALIKHSQERQLRFLPRGPGRRSNG